MNSCSSLSAVALFSLFVLGGATAFAQSPGNPAPPPTQSQPNSSSPSNPAPNNPAPNNPTANNPAPANPKPIGAGAAAGGAPVDSSKYKIGAADVLNIAVWGEPAFSGPVVVHEDGKITLQLIGDLDAGGKTPIEVQEMVANALKKMVVKPLVTVFVQEVGSKRYYLDGQVAHPGEYALVIPTTVLEALSKAGGIGDFANSKKIYILRGTERIPFNYKEVLKGKKMAQNINLKPGDHVVVP